MRTTSIAMSAQAHQPRQIGAQHVRVLRAGPDGAAASAAARRASRPARTTGRSTHASGRARRRCAASAARPRASAASTSPSSTSTALRRRVGAQRLLEVVERAAGRATASSARAVRAAPARHAPRARPRCRRSRGCTTTARMPGMCAIEDSSTDSSVLPMKSPWSAPAYGGRTTRPCSMPGTRMSCTKTSSPRDLGRDVDARHASVPTMR